MDEVLARLALIAGALVVAWLASLAMRRRSVGSPRRIESTGLVAGVYLFSSSACPDCGPVRRLLDEALGEAGYVEMSWEEQPGMFHDLGITGVPATLVVDQDGAAVVWPGKPDRALGTLGP
ncbi:MAG: hypothetical protein U9N56_00905 [Actinomycetota bacterium]|nr:hypothetical protein [Actinomycetota bacterium]